MADLTGIGLPVTALCTCERSQRLIWQFSKIRGTIFRGPNNKDSSILGPLILGNYHLKRKGQCKDDTSIWEDYRALYGPNI